MQSRRARRFEVERRSERRAAPLEDGHGQPAGRCSGKRQAQRRHRSLGCGARRPEQEGGGAAGRRRDLQAPHGAGVGMRCPAQHGIRRTARQRLLGRPERVALGGRRDDDEPRQIDARSRPGRRMQRVRRADRQRPAALGTDRGERRHQQAQLAQARAIDEEFAQGAARPAAAGQFGIERGKAARHRRQRRRRDAVAAPDIGPRQHFGQHPHHSALPLRIRPTASPSMASGPSTTMGA